MTWKIKQVARPKLKKIVLIEGLPGMGNVGKIAVDFMIDSLKAKKMFEIYSYSFPHSVFVNEDNLVELPLIKIYYKKLKNKCLLFLAGDIQPLDEESCYEFCEQILDIFEDYRGKEIITLGGIGLQRIPRQPKVYCTANNKAIINKYAIDGVSNNLYGVVSPIIGVSGLLIGLAGQRKIEAVSLLAETFSHPTYLGIKGAREILKTLNKTLKLNLELSRLDNEINIIEKDIRTKRKEISKVSREMTKVTAGSDINYIG